MTILMKIHFSFLPLVFLEHLIIIFWIQSTHSFLTPIKLTPPPPTHTQQELIQYILGDEENNGLKDWMGSLGFPPLNSLFMAQLQL